MINKEKIIAKLEKETKRTYAIKTALFDGKENKPISEVIHREPFVTITIETADKILKLLKEQPEIIRCKECEHYRKDGYCKYNNHVQMNKYWFCADGGRKEGR